jgi:hypothetical protein
VLQKLTIFAGMCVEIKHLILFVPIYFTTHVIYIWWKFILFIREAWCVVGISINISAHQQHSICAREWIMRSPLFWIESHRRIFPAQAPVCVRQTQHELWPRLSSWNARWSCEPIYMCFDLNVIYGINKTNMFAHVNVLLHQRGLFVNARCRERKR